jgi:hypothetical protein
MRQHAARLPLDLSLGLVTGDARGVVHARYPSIAVVGAVHGSILLTMLAG